MIGDWDSCKCDRCTITGWMRSPKTTNEKRRVGRRGRSVEGVRVRAKRSMKNLADAWDDLVLIHQRSWKTKGKYKHQWEKNLNPPIPCKWRRW